MNIFEIHEWLFEAANRNNKDHDACDICGESPMTVDCNNANCDKGFGTKVLNIPLTDLTYSVKVRRLDGIVKARLPFNRFVTNKQGKVIKVKVKK